MINRTIAQAVILAVLVLAASITALVRPAAAQTRTTCSEGGGAIVCKTQAAPSGFDDRCAGGDWFVARCSLGQHRQALARAKLREAVGARVAAGDCSGAIAEALKLAEVELARAIKETCAPSN